MQLSSGPDHRNTSHDAFYSWTPWLTFALIAAFMFFLNPFPSLYGDEYWSMAEARDLGLNLAGIGYFVQLKGVMLVTDNDWLLRSLSLFWAAVSVWALKRWLDLEPLTPSTRLVMVLLWVVNPFFWVFAQQVRYYAYFTAASVLVIWRFRAWQITPGRPNLGWLILSVLLLCTAQIFSVLVLAALAASWIWGRLGRWKWLFVLVSVIGMLVLFLPPVRERIVLLGQRLQNTPANADAGARGVGVASFSKIVLTFFSFGLGRRVYPLWWWVTIPSLAILAVTFVRGLIRLHKLPKVFFLITMFLLEIPLMFLVVEPLTPPDMAGIAAKHIIFVLPAFLVTLGLGAADKWWLKAGLAATQVIGLVCLLWPQWSQEPLDLIDWRTNLKRWIEVPDETFVIVGGGRGVEERVRRYLPERVRLNTAEDGIQLLNALPKRLLLISNDHRLEMLRPLDDFALSLDKRYKLLTNVTIFPAQITVYEWDQAGGLINFYPSRLAIPEQDLRLPLKVSPEDWPLPGFMRLDDKRPTVTLPGELQPGRFMIASNYRTDRSLPAGTPVAKVSFEQQAGDSVEFVLRSNEHTADWRAREPKCRALATWTKRLHLVGQQHYPGAYEEYVATVWGTESPRLKKPAYRVLVQSLLDKGTFYFWGIFPEKQ